MKKLVEFKDGTYISLATFDKAIADVQKQIVAEKKTIALLPHLNKDDKAELKNYSLKLDYNNKYDGACVYGTKDNIIAYCKEYLDYECSLESDDE